MSFIQCIQAKVDAGLLNKQVAKKVIDKYEATYDKWLPYYQQAGKTTTDAHFAAQNAAESYLKDLQDQAKAIAFQKAKEASLADDLEKQVDQLKQVRQTRTKAQEAWDTVMSRVTSIGLWREGVINKLKSVDSHISSDSVHAIANMGEMLERLYGPDAVEMMVRYNRSPELMQKVYAAIIDGNASDPFASAYAKAFLETNRDIYGKFVKNGGSMEFIENRAPQVLLRERIETVEFDEFFDDMKGWLNRDKIISRETGLPMEDFELEAIARNIYADVLSDGFAKEQRALAQGMPGKIPNPTYKRRAHSRFFQFSDSSAFLEFNRKYGYGDAGLANALIADIKSFAKLNTIIRELGPMPEKTRKEFDRLIKLNQAVDEAEKGESWLMGAVWGELIGRSGYAKEGLTMKLLDGTKNMSRMLLGAVNLASIPADSFLTKLIPMVNGISNSGGMKRYWLNVSMQDKAVIANQHRINMLVMDGALEAERMSGVHSQAKTWLGRQVNNMMRFQGMPLHTERISDVASMQLASHLGVAVEKQTPWQKQDLEFKELWLKNGLFVEDYDRMLQLQPLRQSDGTAFLPYDYVRQQDAGLGHKLNALDTDQRNKIANMPDIYMRAVSHAGMKKGSIGRELTEVAFLFKTFPTMIMRNLLFPAVRRSLGGGKGAAQFFEIGASLTIGGYVSMQLIEMAKGREPKELNRHTMAEAFLRGGFGGYVGDILLSAYNKNAKDAIYGLIGPGYNLIGQATLGAAFALQNDVADMLDGKEPKGKALKHIAKLAIENVPYSTLFWWRGLYDAFVKEPVMEAVDEDYRAKLRRQMRDQQVKYGQSGDNFYRDLKESVLE